MTVPVIIHVAPISAPTAIASLSSTATSSGTEFLLVPLLSSYCAFYLLVSLYFFRYVQAI